MSFFLFPGYLLPAGDPPFAGLFRVDATCAIYVNENNKRYESL
jgi:hypothetical protein